MTGQLLLRMLEHRSLRLARVAPRREHVEHDDLAAEVSQALLPRRAEQRELRLVIGSEGMAAVGDGGVD